MQGEISSSSSPIVGGSRGEVIKDRGVNYSPSARGLAQAHFRCREVIF